MKIGYARVSTGEQNLTLQKRALQKMGCRRIFSDHGFSGADFTRPGLRDALEEARSGDMLVVWRLDRLGRSLIDLVEFIDKLGKKDIQFRSMMESIDTNSSGGRLIFHVMAALAEFERALISERTRAGMEAARAAGIHIGRRPALTHAQSLVARREIEHGASLIVVAAAFNVHPRTLKKHISALPAKPGPISV